MMIHIDYGVLDDCKNLKESYGEICVRCNKCGRFDPKQEEAADDKTDNSNPGI